MTPPPNELLERQTLPRALRVMAEPPPLPSVTAAVRLGFEGGLARVFRRSAALSAALGAALVVTGAVIERVANPASAATGALMGAFRLVLPLVAFGAVAEVTDRARLDDAAWPIARFGVSRREAALGLVLAAIAVTAAFSAVVAVAAVVLAHGPADPPLAKDAFAVAWIGALTGAAYVGWFSFGATFFRRGWGRSIPLFADFVLGATPGLFGLLLPRGNAQNLLGGVAPLGLAQPASTAALVAMTLVLTTLAALRCKD